MMNIDEVVIVGAGICGLATALALHKKGIKSLVVERSESLRNITGAAITIRQNGWQALDQLGVGDILRSTAFTIKSERIVWFDAGKQQEISVDGETRCLRRRDLIDSLYAALPLDTVKFGCQLESIKLQPVSGYPILLFTDGSSIIAKVVIGCDGVNSIVADFLNLKPTKMFSYSSVRGLTYYPNGHSFGQEFVRIIKDNNFVGRNPINDNLVYWFSPRPNIPRDEIFWHDPEFIKRSTLELINDYPQEVQEMIESTDMKSLSIGHLRYRTPWDLLTGTFHRGTMTVAGDAMHVMGPFLGQGGSSGLEDAIVLARNLVHIASFDPVECRMKVVVGKVGEAFDQYVKQRRMRLVRLTLQNYLAGMIFRGSSWLKKIICIMFLVLLFHNQSGHINYDCGVL